MTMKENYKKGDRFFAVSFNMGDSKLNTPKLIAERILESMSLAVNIRAIPCVVVENPACLMVSRDDYSVSVFNSKDIGEVRRR
jgi:pimeloyl-CoA synthetase